jgi:hypothetical protein|tara:strand:+ start:516 stop:1778 length:1263 start_codon:yes stop_codon:yes gene_type:complete
MNPELKRFLAKLEKVADYEVVYIEPNYDFRKANSRLVIKITDKSAIPKIAADKNIAGYGFTPSGDKYVSSKLVNVALTPSGGVRGTGKLPRKGEAVTIPSTAEQESGTISYFAAAFKNKKIDLKKISDEVGYPFAADWMHNFEQQYRAFSSNMGTGFNKHKIYLDSEKNDSNILFNLAKKFGLKDLKDNWNPSDIWIMSLNRSQVIAQTKDVTSLLEFNAWMVDKYESKEIVGVSLKKVSANKTGKFQTVSTLELPDVDVTVSRVLFDPFQKNFILETDGNIKGFNLRVGYKAATVSRDSDIRIYLEGRQKGAAVQLGAVSAQLFPDLAAKNGFIIPSDKQKILNDPMKYLNTTLPKLLKNPVVVDKVSPFPDSEIALKAGAFLTYYLEILLNSDPDILKSCYYSSTKTNDFSSIHCKLY